MNAAHRWDFVYDVLRTAGRLYDMQGYPRHAHNCAMQIMALEAVGRP